MMLERVVYDTNIMISGLLWRGKPYQCLQLARSGVVQAVYCPEMLDELVEKLREKFLFSAGRIQVIVDDWKSHALKVEIGGKLQVIADDPDDNMFIECAQVAQAKIIVSGDRHLTGLVEYEGVRILRAAEFLTRVSEQREETEG